MNIDSALAQKTVGSLLNCNAGQLVLVQILL